MLPVEVVGTDGTVVSLSLVVPREAAGQVKSLRMQIHGLEYAGMASVQVNRAGWVALSNDTVEVSDPARSYGGIGGGFATVKMKLSLAAGTVVAGDNTIRFRFNHTDGISSGFRVLAFNFVTQDGRVVLQPSEFAEDDPDRWVSPLPDAQDIATGEKLWRGGRLVASSLAGAAPIAAHCADCHAEDGRDLKYFNYSNRSIVARSQFHGLSALQGRQIASYIRALPYANPGRPWNPPYQPGAGLDAKPVGNWAAGAGMASVLDDDVETLPFVFAPSDGQITREDFCADGNLNARQIPIALQLPDWNHWLPRVHPLDAWGSDFGRSELSREYLDLSGGGKPIPSDGLISLFTDWSKSRDAFLKRHESGEWSPQLAQKVYSTQLWQLVKTWQVTEALNLEAPHRTWLNTMAAATAPAAAGIPDGTGGMGGCALTNEYFNNAWYELQVVLSNGIHQRQPGIDWVYMIGRTLDLYHLSHRPEPGRVLVAVIKAMQSTDPSIGPENVAKGWRPNQNIDPRIMIAGEWASVFDPIPNEQRQAITEALLGAWLDKNHEYQIARYFTRGLSDRSYALPADLQDISGGKVWEAAQQFQNAGVSRSLVRRLVKWGRAYADMARRFEY